MKIFLLCLLLTCSFLANAQVYNNEWIDYKKTYYKFKIRTSGVYRISQPVLAAAGLGNIPAEQFQLWRDGEQLPVYTSVPAGTMGSSDYIEFWGEKNNGKVDKALFRKPEYHLNADHSLISDTAYYFLTVNPAGNNLRLTTTANETTNNTLPAEPYFLQTVVNAPTNQVNGGEAFDAGQFLYSSSYDKGEGWSYSNIGVSTVTPATHSNLFVYPTGPVPKFKIAVSGNTNDIRTYKVVINNDSILGKTLSFFDYSIDSVTFPVSVISSGTAAVKITNSAGRMVFHKYELTYPRLFNFGASKNFEFTLPSSPDRRYLQISNFSFGTVAPVLYDLTNRRRYVGDITAKPLVKFVIQPSPEARFVLVNEETTNITNITTLQQRNFTNYAEIGNQSDFIIISNPLLFNGTNGTNPVEEYRAYRSSSAGGGYNAKVYLVDDLTDQFAFGIKKHPVGLRNFILFARNKFATAPKHVLLLGKGVIYTVQRSSESNTDINNFNLVPTFGAPASDVLLTADPGSSVGKVSIGRISAVSAQEVSDYLDKVKEFESVQAQASPEVTDKLWMKNVLHIVGVSEPALQTVLESNMAGLSSIIRDSLYGARITTLTKQTGNNIEQINSEVLKELFSEGMSLITYFGHSGASTLSFNLDNPEAYNNKGKYPLFIAMGCDVGNIFGFNSTRFSVKPTLSETYVLAQGKGTIGFIASTHYGIVRYLDSWSKYAYNSISKTNYGNSIGEILNIAANLSANEYGEDFLARCNIEQTCYHGDPSIMLNTHAKPDYVIKDQLVSVSPSFVSISETSFKIKAGLRNIGKAEKRDIAIEVKRAYPDQTSQVVYKDTISGLFLADSITLDLPIDPQHDKGSNKLTITIDADGAVDELFESNNTITKEVFIFEDEVKPIYPYNFAIVNDPNVILSASTADPLSPLREYKFEIDTTELFNSPYKVTKTLSSKGGLLEFAPGVTFADNTVYFWRVAIVPTSGEYHWNGSSFIYLKDSDPGFNQSHLYQHLKTEFNNIQLDTFSRSWSFKERSNSLLIRNGTWNRSSTAEVNFSIAINDNTYKINNACSWNSLIFTVFDSKIFQPLENTNGGLYGSVSNTCALGRQNNFEFRYTDSTSRKAAMDFMEKIIPDGAYVVVRSFALDPAQYTTRQHAYISDWIQDTSTYGSGKSLYHYLKNAGLSSIDSFYRTRPWILVYKKGNRTFTPKWIMGEGVLDNVVLSVNCPTPGQEATILSPVFSIADKWKELHWDGDILEDDSTDIVNISLWGINKSGHKDLLLDNIQLDQKQVDISSINALLYPNVQIKMDIIDSINYTPFQLKKCQLIYDPVAEGAIAPNIYFNMKDTIEAGENIEFRIAYKNVSKVNFDSLQIKVVITGENNTQHILPIEKFYPLIINDTLNIYFPIDTKQLNGKNTLYVEVNPDDEQKEQFRFNNFIYYNFYVNSDQLNPVVDVTFDNIHILNGDIVSAKPHITIKMKDESNKLLLNDSSLLLVKVRYPDNSIRTFTQDNDTLQFFGATQTYDNTATVNFKPYFTQDGEYELIISGKDKSGNKLGNTEYRIAFQVINKPMISNLFNYPNPFTSSTAFVFTLTGSEVPQNIKIQILTITGKIVREITQQEIGNIRIGRNITDFKWDGTDLYGQKLANGIYLYHVITALNGKPLDKYRAENENTDKYFYKGYGKMYLMR